jgi:hypothetical protein
MSGRMLVKLRPTTIGGRRRRAPVRRRVGRPRLSAIGGRRRVRRAGAGWWDTVKEYAGKAYNYAKDNKLISRGIRQIPSKYADSVADIADKAGYGRRRRRRRVAPRPPMMGGRRRMAPRVARMTGGRRRVGGRVIFPAENTTGLGGMVSIM